MSKMKQTTTIAATLLFASSIAGCGALLGGLGGAQTPDQAEVVPITAVGVKDPLATVRSMFEQRWSMFCSGSPWVHENGHELVIEGFCKTQNTRWAYRLDRLQRMLIVKQSPRDCFNNGNFVGTRGFCIVGADKEDETPTRTNWSSNWFTRSQDDAQEFVSAMVALAKKHGATVDTAPRVATSAK